MSFRIFAQGFGDIPFPSVTRKDQRVTEVTNMLISLSDLDYVLTLTEPPSVGLDAFRNITILTGFAIKLTLILKILSSFWKARDPYTPDPQKQLKHKKQPRSKRSAASRSVSFERADGSPAYNALDRSHTTEEQAKVLSDLDSLSMNRSSDA